MKIPQSFLIKSLCLPFLLLFSQYLEAQAQATPERRKDVKAPADTSWNQLSAGDKMFVNSQVFNPAGLSLDLAKGTRVLNLELAHQNRLLISKSNKGLAV